MTLALEMQSITKRFPGVLANDHVNFQLKKGEIHALLGENGAGKSTLMNILYGLYSQDEGQVLLNGRKVSIGEPTDAIKLGIGMVHQHFMLIPVMTVAENIILGTEIVKNGFVLDLDTAAQRIRDLSRKYGLEVDPGAYIKDLSVGTQQRVEIVKALYREADVLILDEPTAVLTPQEAEELFVIMRSLVEQGKSIIFITHKLGEVLAVADRITVLRNGHVVGIAAPAESSKESLAEMMVGREVILTVDKGPAQLGSPVLQVENLSILDDRETLIVNNVSFEVQAGEILGVAGVQGNGQTELVEVLTGLRRCLDGQVVIGEVDVTNASPRKITDLGVTLEGSAHIPEDRHEHGMVYGYSIADNLVLNTYYKPPFARGVVMDHRAIEDHALRVVHEFDIRTPSVYTPGSSLSGGNQQKVVVGRELSRPIQLLIAAQPTRGLDVGSIEFIHNRLVQARDAGVAVLLVSAELDEIMSLSDRIAVIYEGEIVDIVPAGQLSKEDIGLRMCGWEE
ncbi:MAG: ABC transporter ATP-binding protein [Chloroflexi bacterium]|nr:ABC transporter ATP-binding protein [Chloroflexota bacterium]